jgi:hypothetical protein
MACLLILAHTSDNTIFQASEASFGTLPCPSRKLEDIKILDFSLSHPHFGLVCFRSFHNPS